MDKTEETSFAKYLHTLREHYSKRIDEADAFYKRMTNMGVEVNTEFLYGCLDVVQHYLDLQQKYSNQFPWFYPPELLTKVISQNTQAWVQTIHNMDSFGTDGMKNMKNNLRTLNKNTIESIKNAEKIAETCRDFHAEAKPITAEIHNPEPSSQKPNPT